MPDKRLRMVAELQDRASGPMRKIKEAAAGIRQTPGMAQARTWMVGFNKEAESFMKGGRGLVDVMSGMGIGGLAAAASIGTLVARFKELGDHTLAMRELGREVGLTTDQVNQFNHAANHFGFDPDKMQGALDHFAGLMPEFRRGFGELNSVLSKQPDLIKRLRLEDTKTQLKEIFNFLGTIQNPQDRIKFEQQIFGQNIEPLFAEGADGFEKQLDRYAKTLQPITKEMEDQAVALREAITEFNDAVGNLETKYGPQILGTLKEGALEVKHMFDDVVRVVDTLQKWKDHPFQSFVDATKDKAEEIKDRDAYRLRRHFGSGDFAPAGSVADANARLGTMDAERASLDGKDDEKSRIRAEELGEATKQLRDWIATAVPDAERLADLRAQLAETEKRIADTQAKSKLGPGVESPTLLQLRDQASDLRGQLLQAEPRPVAEPARPPAGWTPPATTPFRTPSAYDREMRARGPRDGKDHSLDGVVVGAIERPILHLAGTLKTAAAATDQGPVRQAAFHPTGLITPAGGMDPAGIIEAGVKAGVLAAFREWAGGVSSDASTGRPGIMPASFGGGGGGGGNPALGGGSFGGTGGRTAASKDLTPESRALLDTLASGEAPDYNVMNGGGRFSDYSHHPGGRAAGRYQFLPSTWRRVSAALGLHDFTPESQDKGAWWLAQDDYRKRTGGDLAADLRSRDPSRIAAIGRALHPTWVSLNGSFGGKYQRYLDRQSSAAAGDGSGGSSAPGLIRGNLKIGDETYAYGSGGAAGSASIPFGDYPINPDSKNPWGRAHDAMDVNGTGTIWDKALGRMRTGIEMHAASTAEMVTHGCLGFMRDQYPQLKQRVREMIQRTGKAYLHIDKNGASITPEWHKPDRPNLGEERQKAGLSGPQAVKVAGGIDAHVTLHDNGRSSARVESSGHVRDAGITVRRAPQRTATA